MESEYDRWVPTLLVCTGKARQEIHDLGFKPDRIVKLLRELKERFCAWENINIAAKDMVELRLKEKKVKLERTIGQIEKTMESVRGKWTDARVGDLEEQTIAFKEFWKVQWQHWSVEANRMSNDSTKLPRGLLVVLLLSRESQNEDWVQDGNKSLTQKMRNG